MASSTIPSMKRTLASIDKKIEAEKQRFDNKLAPLYAQREIIASAVNQMEALAPELPALPVSSEPSTDPTETPTSESQEETQEPAL